MMLSNLLREQKIEIFICPVLNTKVHVIGLRSIPELGEEKPTHLVNFHEKPNLTLSINLLLLCFANAVS
ncbi:MAG: hypothetical protein AABX73_00300 [Nanoarchaeota archaeon]